MSDNKPNPAAPTAASSAAPQPSTAASSAAPQPSTSAASQPAAATPKARPQKRRRTRSHNSSPSPGRGFFIPGYEENPGSEGPARMMSLSEVMDAAKGLTNMYLAHEIAVDKDFMLQDLKQPEHPLQSAVKEVIHRAFWDSLDAQLKEEPPVFDQAIVLLQEIKESLLGMLVPAQKRVIDAINEKFDIELMTQLAESGSLNFREYSEFIVKLMSQLCAPVRDEQVAELRNHLDNPVTLFKGIMSALDLMKLDMANFHIQQARPLIVNNSVEYEQAKFKEFLEKLPQGEDGLATTKQWLKRHSPIEELDASGSAPTQEARFRKLLVNRVLNDSYLELLEWDEYYPLPETLMMDSKRILAIRDLTERTAVNTGIILLTFSNVSGFVIPMDAQKLKETIKSHLDVLLQDFHDDDDLLKILPNCALQVIKDVDDYLHSKSRDLLPESTKKNLQDQIAEMENPNHRIRDLVQRRILEFNKSAICTARSAPLQVPPGLTLCQRELAQIAGAFVRLVNYNRAVFGEFYNDIIENHVLFRPELAQQQKNEA